MTTLYAATGDDIVQLRPSTNDQWQISPLLTGVGAQCLAVDPLDPAHLYAGTFDRGAFGSHDGGRSWTPVGAGIPHGRVLSIQVSASEPANSAGTVYAGTEPSGLYRSRDGGETWEDLPALRELPSAPTWSFPPRPWTSHVRWIATSWFDPALLFVGIELGGVMRSSDGGRSWEDRKPGSYHDSHVVLTHPRDASRVYEAAGGGVAWSLDAGASWQPVDQGMDRHYVWGLAVDPEDPDLWYVSATFSARHAHYGRGPAEALIYRRAGDGPWQPLSIGDQSPLPDMPYALLAPLDRPGELYAGMHDGELWHSADRGESWRRLDIQLPAILALAAVPD